MTLGSTSLRGLAAMIEDDLFAAIDPILAGVSALEEEGEEFLEPAIDILRYYRHPVRLQWIPWLGRGWGVAAVARQPIDLSLKTGMPTLVERIARAVATRFPPGRDGRWGTIGLTAIVLTPEPIGPDDDAVLQAALTTGRRSRVVPLGLIRLNLGQEAMAMALTTAPDGLFPEPIAVADALTLKFRRFVSLIDV